jgi:hypothetical protein
MNRKNMKISRTSIEMLQEFTPMCSKQLCFLSRMTEDISELVRKDHRLTELPRTASSYPADRKS